jgi:hypothetical protein
MKQSCLLAALLFFCLASNAQSRSVGIGNNSPDSNAILDLTNPGKVLLLPRLSATAINNISNPVAGMIAYDSMTDRFMRNSNAGRVNAIDQPAGNINFSFSGIGQSFAAPLNGRLAGIQMTIGSALVSATAKIYAGEGTGGTVLATINTTISNTGNTRVNFDFSNSGLYLGAGQQYTFYLTVSTAVLAKISTANPYPGGNLYDQTGPKPANDLNFTVVCKSNQWMALADSASLPTNVVTTTTDQDIDGAKTFSSPVTAPYFFGDGSTLSNIVNSNDIQTIDGSKTFSSPVIAPSFSGDGSTLSNIVNTTGTQTIDGTKTFSSPVTATSFSGNGSTLSFPTVITVPAVNTPTTAVHNMLAAAYGVIDGATTSLVSSSGNCTLVRNSTGFYTISFTGNNLSTADLSTCPFVVTLSSTGGAIGWVLEAGNTGSVNVYCYNQGGAFSDRRFSFVLYKP